MPVELVCTACTARLRVPGFTPGRAVRCPKCATVFVPAAPPPEPSAPPPAAVAPPVPPPPPAPPAPAENPFDFDKKPEPQRTSAATKNAKIVGAPNAKSPPRAQPVAPKAKAKPRDDDDDDAPAPRAKTADQPRPANKTREREKDARPINPAVLVGGLAFLALGAAILAGVLIFGGDKGDAKRAPAPVPKDKVDPPKPPEPEPLPPEPEPDPKPPEPKRKPAEKFKPPLFPQLNPPAPDEPEPDPAP